MKRDLIIFRHGRRFIDTKEASGDGPLTPAGIARVQVQAKSLAKELKALSISTIDLAVVSGSIRCSQTFALIWTVLHSKGIVVKEYDMRRKYFGTKLENAGWKSMYVEHGDALRKMIRSVGEKEAVMKFAADLVNPCVQRTNARISRAFNKDEARTVIVVTHAPHDALIEESFTGVAWDDCLEMGDYRIITL